MKNYIVCFVSAFALIGCGSAGNNGGTPKGLAEGACECWKEAKTLQNETAKARKADECYAVTRRALSELREMGVQNDWTSEQVNQAQKEFDSVYDNCK